MPEENTQAQRRKRITRLDIRPRDLDNTQKSNQPVQKPNIAKKRRVLEKSKNKTSRGRFSIKKPTKKMVGFGFWMIVGVAIFKELMDLFILLMQFATDISTVAGLAAGLYTDSTVVGVATGVVVKFLSYIPFLAPIALGINLVFTLLWWVIGIITTTAVSFAIWYYLAIANGISFGMRKLAMFMVVFLVESIPVLNLVPSTVLVLFIIRKMENSKKQNRFIGVAKNRYR